MIDLTDKNYQDMQVENSLESVNLKRLNDAMKLAKEQLYGLSEERKTIHWVSVQFDMYDFFNSTRFYCPYCKEMRFEVNRDCDVAFCKPFCKTL